MAVRYLGKNSKGQTMVEFIMITAALTVVFVYMYQVFAGTAVPKMFQGGARLIMTTYG